jgi:hypothetical protein
MDNYQILMLFVASLLTVCFLVHNFCLQFNGILRVEYLLITRFVANPFHWQFIEILAVFSILAAYLFLRCFQLKSEVTLVVSYSLTAAFLLFYFCSSLLHKFSPCLLLLLYRFIRHLVQFEYARHKHQNKMIQN